MYQKEQWQEHWVSENLPWRSADSDRVFMERFREITAMADMKVTAESRAFVPLCGDSTVVRALWKQGVSVTALDYIPEAIDELAKACTAELGIKFSRRQNGERSGYSGERMLLLVEDMFETTFKEEFSIIYDRGALVALPAHLRKPYAALIAKALTPGGVLYIVSNDFDDSRVSRPPYAVSKKELMEHYGSFEVLDSTERVADVVPPRLVEAGVTALTNFTTVLRKRI